MSGLRMVSALVGGYLLTVCNLSTLLEGTVAGYNGATQYQVLPSNSLHKYTNVH